MSFSISGKIKVIQDLQQISDTFKKREFVLVDESSQYPQFINFQTVQDKTAMLDGLNAGDEIEVNFNLRGREWTSPQGEVKYFNSLDAWKVTKTETVRVQSASAAAPMAAAPAAAPTASSLPPLPETEDDLPF